ncbi:hypothetical protein, partial [Vibrio chemaguriensis]|uniref:hypothetical protein n=1 Tax=Vibrio chemaguriensis TaxID=2527672 RepID=UPI001CDD6BFA
RIELSALRNGANINVHSARKCRRSMLQPRKIYSLKFGERCAVFHFRVKQEKRNKKCPYQRVSRRGMVKLKM